MTSAPRARLVQALDPRVLAFEIRSVGFHLEHNLDMLDQVRTVQAPEAVAFYAARIWEAMTREELRTICQPQESMAENLRLLTEYCRLPAPLFRWLHRLRELGNEARHVQRNLSAHDAELAFAIVLRWLHWYFCQYPERDDRLPTLTIHKQPLDGLLPDELADLLGRLDRAEDVDAEFLKALRLDRPDCLLLMTPILPAVLVEALLGRNRYEEAHRILSAARERFPRALRLSQLEALYHSRLGRANRDPAELGRARKILERLRGVDSAADEETLGMLGGVYKHLSDLNANDPGLLRQSHNTYRSGWERSQEQNNYLGINSATTALWLGEGERAASIAGRVRSNLEVLFGHLAGASAGPRSASYWDQVTLAEALLLAGEVAEAGLHYRQAIREFAGNTGDHKVARDQAERILRRRGEAHRIREVFGD